MSEQKQQIYPGDKVRIEIYDELPPIQATRYDYPTHIVYIQVKTADDWSMTGWELDARNQSTSKLMFFQRKIIKTVERIEG